MHKTLNSIVLKYIKICGYENYREEDLFETKDVKMEVEALSKLIMLSLQKHVEIFKILYMIEDSSSPKVKAIEHMSKTLSKIDYSMESKDLVSFLNTFDEINLDDIDNDTMYLLSNSLKNYQGKER